VRELSLHILDVLENAVEAGASRIGITIDEDAKADRMVIEIVDNGRGMRKDGVERVLDPFYTTRTRDMLASDSLSLQRRPAAATEISLFNPSRARARGESDIPPQSYRSSTLGDISTALLAILLSDRPVDLRYCHKVDSRNSNLILQKQEKNSKTFP